MNELRIEHLSVEVNQQEILHDISLNIQEGEVHALMGPNGSGKSSLALTLMGHPDYSVTGGDIVLGGESLLETKPDERARKGLFLSFQNPPHIAGVSVSNFLRLAYQSVTGEKVSIVDFYAKLKSLLSVLQMDEAFLKRSLNDGFSGGERKKMEVLQMLLLKPRFIILDETDSGLDRDALDIVARGIQSLMREHACGVLLISHYEKMLHAIAPTTVHVIKNGSIVRTGGIELAQEIEAHGYGV